MDIYGHGEKIQILFYMPNIPSSWKHAYFLVETSHNTVNSVLNGSIMKFSNAYLVAFLATASGSTNIDDVSVSYQ